MNIKIRNEYTMKVSKVTNVEVGTEMLVDYIKNNLPIFTLTDLRTIIVDFVLSEIDDDLLLQDDNTNDVYYDDIIVTNLDELTEEFSYFVTNYDDNN